MHVFIKQILVNKCKNGHPLITETGQPSPNQCVICRLENENSGLQESIKIAAEFIESDKPKQALTILGFALKTFTKEQKELEEEELESGTRPCQRRIVHGRRIVPM